METISTTEVITALAQGCDPSTGEELEPGNIVHRPLVLRALFEAKALLERRDLVDRRRQINAKSGVLWTPEEEQVLVAGFESGKSFHDLGRELMRSAGAIQARLIKLGKIEDNGQLRFIKRA